MLNFFTLLNQCKCKLICKSENHLHNNDKNYELVLKSIALEEAKLLWDRVDCAPSFTLVACRGQQKWPRNSEKVSKVSNS